MEDVGDRRRINQLVLTEIISFGNKTESSKPHLNQGEAENTYTHGNLLLRENDGAILAPDPNGHYVGRGDGLECIFW